MIFKFIHMANIKGNKRKACAAYQTWKRTANKMTTMVRSYITRLVSYWWLEWFTVIIVGLFLPGSNFVKFSVLGKCLPAGGLRRAKRILKSFSAPSINLVMHWRTEDTNLRTCSTLTLTELLSIVLKIYFCNNSSLSKFISGGTFHLFHWRQQSCEIGLTYSRLLDGSACYSVWIEWLSCARLRALNS